MHVLAFVGDHFYSKFIEIISLKAPQNYPASFWSNTISVLFCEGPKSQNSMISRFVDPWEPLFIDLNIPKLLRNI